MMSRLLGPFSEMATSVSLRACAATPRTNGIGTAAAPAASAPASSLATSAYSAAQAGWWSTSETADIGTGGGGT